MSCFSHSVDPSWNGSFYQIVYHGLTYVSLKICGEVLTLGTSELISFGDDVLREVIKSK
jgi:hypothetical protein